MVRVEAELTRPTPAVSLFNVLTVPGLPNGQADLLTELSAEDASGKPVTLRALGEGDYELSAKGRVRLRYSVKLDHDRYAWPAGAKEVLYRTDEGILATGYALFLAPTERTTTPIEVSFTLPPGWTASTPWHTAAGGKVFLPGSRRDLLNNVVFLGTALRETSTLGGVDLTLVLGRRYTGEPSRKLFKELLTRQMASYQRLFGGKPLADRYLIVVN